ncbi:hypothetical protein PV10_02793 [Exophiala mesophila]|uniref:FAD/NAD(P)-binding domain-containing protein n=1 Tax=Exophiala mesophila TaxID=212818 RepID=A0A0D1Y3D0_EXOME|nr:uncharacterized protein PV10_02793 [Exophiala mesophila]KIV95101.1 hypothetical protein PV10_02793 [Exophiala mesophila]
MSLAGKAWAALQILKILVTFSVQNLAFFISTRRRKYELGDNPKNVVIIGGSFGGWTAAQRLAQSLPSGYRVILIEKNSHFYFTWNFPRSTCIPGHAEKAFIPYPKESPSLPEGIYKFVRGTVTEVKEDKVIMEDGSEIDYEYLVVATGSHNRYPSKLVALDKVDAVQYFLDQQERIKQAQNIIVVGGGAAGMEIASDTKSKYPEKNITLVHSRDRLLNTFGPLLHTEAIGALNRLGVTVLLNERVVGGLDVEDPKEITLQSGKVLQCDTLVRCTGQSPRGDLIQTFSPKSIASSGAILVEKTLRISNTPTPRCFAIGDVVDLQGPKLGRGASTQGMFIADQIVRAIKGKALKPYHPTVIDSSIELTLGLGRNTMYIGDGEREASFGKKADEELFVRRMWQVMGIKPYEDPEYEALVKSKSSKEPSDSPDNTTVSNGPNNVTTAAVI